MYQALIFYRIGEILVFDCIIFFLSHECEPRFALKFTGLKIFGDHNVDFYSICLVKSLLDDHSFSLGKSGPNTATFFSLSPRVTPLPLR